MIESIEITERSTCVIPERHLDDIRTIIDENKALPMQLLGNKLAFDDYTIGEFRTSSLSVKITPRNKAYTLSHFFKMLQYTDNPMLPEMESFGYEAKQSDFGIDALSSEFCLLLKKLFQYGLTGNYKTDSLLSKHVIGEIEFDNYRPALIAYEGIPTSVSEYTINMPQNKIIKAALTKLLSIEPDNINPQKSQFLRELDEVDVAAPDEETIIRHIESYTSTNPYYPLALELARKILFNVQLEHAKGSISWMAFLENSNEVFERYAREILKCNLSHKVEKWNSPVKFASIQHSGSNSHKSYSPDIIIDFDGSKNSCRAVLDVKNKPFDTLEASTLSELSSSSDLYQMHFYCQQLGVSIGGLIYPAPRRIEPVEIIFGSIDLTIKLVSLNMSEPMRTRHSQFIKDITTEILNYT